MMTDRFRLSNTLGRRLAEQGVSVEAVLRRAGLPVCLFDQSRIWLTTAEMCAFYGAIHELSDDPAIGLKLGSESRPEYFTQIAIAALYSRTFGEALERMARYKRLTAPEEIRISGRGAECAVEFLWLLGEKREAPTWVDICFSWTITIARRGTGRDVTPLRVELRRPDTHRQCYEGFFGCPVKFGARRNQLVFRSADILQPFTTHNLELLELVEPQLEAELKRQLANRPLTEQVKGILKRFLAGKKPRLEDVAIELRIGARTLQRRLLEDGFTFHELVKESRREMAQHYLRQPALELNETAYLLGYEDPNSFIRAFHKWEGTTPGEWRSSHC